MIECVAVKKISKKGVEYVALEITFPNGYKKPVFLEPAEQYIAASYIVNEQ